MGSASALLPEGVTPTAFLLGDLANEVGGGGVVAHASGGVAPAAFVAGVILSVPLAGTSVCVTGVTTGALVGMSRNEVRELIESLGGWATTGVSAKTSLLLTDDPESGTGKAKKARELGIEIVSPDEFTGRYLDMTKRAPQAPGFSHGVEGRWWRSRQSTTVIQPPRIIGRTGVR